MDSPQGFYLAKDESILHLARGGQVDDRFLFDQLPPCRSERGSSPRCFSEIRDRHLNLMKNFSQQQQPDFAWNAAKLQNKIPLFGEFLWRFSWATLVPRNSSDITAFQTIAFTKTSDKSVGSDLERRSCVIIEENDNAIYQALVLKDVGKIDGVERILFAYPPLQHWSTSLLLHDAIFHFLKDTAILKFGKEIRTYYKQLKFR